jgi:hypothetical protein
VTDIVEPISPFTNGIYIGYTILVPIYPKPICPFINGDIGSTILVLFSGPLAMSGPMGISIPICPKTIK